MGNPDRLRNAGEWVKKHKVGTISIIAFALATPLVGPSLVEAVNQSGRVIEDARKADFERTGGVDLERLKTSFVVTARPNAYSVDSGVLIDGAWSRVSRETECTPVSTISLPENQGRRRWLIGARC